MNAEKEFITENPFAILVRRMNRIESQNEQILTYLQNKNGVSGADEIGGIELAQRVTGLSKARIYALVSERKIPHSKRGNKLFFSHQKLSIWIEDGNRETKGGLDA